MVWIYCKMLKNTEFQTGHLDLFLKYLLTVLVYTEENNRSLVLLVLYFFERPCENILNILGFIQLKFIALQNNERYFPVLDLDAFHCEPCFVTYLVFVAVLYGCSQPVCNSTVILAAAM